MQGDIFQRYALVGLGGAAGSCVRYWLGGAIGTIAARHGSAFPWATFLINVSGSFVIALFLAFALERSSVDPRWRLLVATGFCGGYTTFSTFTWETLQLLQEGSFLTAFANVAASAVLGLLAVYLGIALGRGLG